MGKLSINSIYYKGEQYYYKNDKFHKGINILVGDNENGKSTFTYLIVYGLGINVEYFQGNSNEPINEIVRDSDNYVELDISIENEQYVLKRTIGQNMITVHDKKQGTFVTYSLIRNGYLYKKEGETFSDWILAKLGIDVIEITQNSSTHRINFEDLMRYVYYDQITDNRKIINEFGIKSSDFYKNSNIMKRSIFELLMSGYLEEYYSTYYKIKNVNTRLQEEKENKKSLEIVKQNILKQIIYTDNEDFKENLIEIRKERKRLESIREGLKEEGSFGVEGVNRLTELQKDLVALTHKIKNIEFDLDKVEENLIKAKRVGEDTKNDIEHIDKILFTSQYIDIISEDKCPFCLEPINLEAGHCICGSDKFLDFTRFIYSDMEYIEIMKSKIKTLETINEAINDYKDEYSALEYKLTNTKDELKRNMEEIKRITQDLRYNSNASTIDEITSKIIDFKEKEAQLKLLVEKSEEIRKSEGNINKLEKEIKMNREKLAQLQEQKDNDLQNNIENFEAIYSEYLYEFYNNEHKDYEIKLDRNYMPLLGEYKHQSFNVPKRLFYYLTMLKMSLNDEIKINFPKLLIIDTMKDEGIEINKLIKLFSYFDEFKNKDCQIIITCGYDEYTKALEPYLIGWLSDDDKLLKEISMIEDEELIQDI
ncbi:hypothetical protein LKL81_11245 [Bacillus paranthracis]|uniref:hypothetical protein n=1 Tax=Bacillus TaxID=1386 RepID=UPI00027A0EE4|nr:MULTISPECIES: hypothetical protein [Bacillus]EJR13189.1 hypothetical protein II9_04446 [Bacillus cereus MSX-D12]KMP69676.1 hypothetical protein TU61_02450 [Bacillus cereus]MCC2427796.1 hypothetical protein [Bacillus paranthracis]MDC7739369.1 hypothetical protein [Bacillus sp. FF-1]QPI82562.1 hypothetical protein I0K14_04835 [Bacillus paranthracis]